MTNSEPFDTPSYKLPARNAHSDTAMSEIGSQAGEPITVKILPDEAAAHRHTAPNAAVAFAKAKWDNAKDFTTDKLEDAMDYATMKYEIAKDYAADKAGTAKDYAVDKVDDAKVWAKENPQLAVAAAAGLGVTALTAGMAFLAHLRKEAAYRKGKNHKKDKHSAKEVSRFDKREIESEARGIVHREIDEDEFIELLEDFINQLEE